MLFLHKFLNQETVKKRKCWENVSLNTTENNSITLIFFFFFFFRMEEGTHISITNSGLQRGSWNLGKWCFQCLEVIPFWLLD